MERDMDLVREVLLQIEADKQPHSVEGHSEEKILGHFELVIKAGLAEGNITHNSMGKIAFVHASKLTWAGHDFLDSIKDPKIYESARGKILKVGGSWTIEILKTLCIAELKQRLGLPLG